VVLIGVLGSLTIGIASTLADQNEDERHLCFDMKKHGELLAQQLEASKQCDKHKYETSVTLTCSYSFDGTVIQVKSTDPGGAQNEERDARYTFTSLGPNVTLSFGQGAWTWGYPLLERVAPVRRRCRYDVAWVRSNDVIIASKVTGAM